MWQDLRSGIIYAEYDTCKMTSVHDYCVRQNAYYLRLFHSRWFYHVRGYWSRMLGYFSLWPPSWTKWYTLPRCHTGIDPMPDKMNVCSGWPTKKKALCTSGMWWKGIRAVVNSGRWYGIAYQLGGSRAQLILGTWKNLRRNFGELFAEVRVRAVEEAKRLASVNDPLTLY